MAAQRAGVRGVALYSGGMTPADATGLPTHSELPLELATRIVDHAAIARNIDRVRRITGKPIMAVVKADGFGHGCLEVARTALDAGAEWLGVATIDEAIALRRSGIEAPVLCWLADPWTNLSEAVRAGITISVANRQTLAAVARAVELTEVAAEIHLELDTGMSRGGAEESAWDELCSTAAQAELSGLLRVTGIWSHLALAADPNPEINDGQRHAFDLGVELARLRGLRPTILHLANSAAALEHEQTWYDLVRLGASLYGIETVHDRSHELEPAMRVVSRISQLRRVPIGVGVSYNSTFITDKPTTLALVPVGYGDGVPRRLSNGGSVVIGGSRHPIVGAISMDQLVVDVGDTPVQLGDEVVLLGSPANGEPDAQEWADLTGTIAHEIFTGLGGRMARRHINQTDQNQTDQNQNGRD